MNACLARGRAQGGAASCRPTSRSITNARTDVNDDLRRSPFGCDSVFPPERLRKGHNRSPREREVQPIPSHHLLASTAVEWDRFVGSEPSRPILTPAVVGGRPPGSTPVKCQSYPLIGDRREYLTRNRESAVFTLGGIERSMSWLGRVCLWTDSVAGVRHRARRRPLRRWNPYFLHAVDSCHESRYFESWLQSHPGWCEILLHRAYCLMDQGCATWLDRLPKPMRTVCARRALPC